MIEIDLKYLKTVKLKDLKKIGFDSFYLTGYARIGLMTITASTDSGIDLTVFVAYKSIVGYTISNDPDEGEESIFLSYVVPGFQEQVQAATESRWTGGESYAHNKGCGKLKLVEALHTSRSRSFGEDSGLKL